ncbi:hypothetical protein [Longimicrobium sp.]|uniref:hypothetical protein n=1 Tax=Longimicrobium sp. TaxID=2029185 RepID=UPI002E36B717|nr:hypothetical protein [Longimicrobium sp.]HEX6037258.1 hypothetical protein [Longimicrobium sp.]
MPRKRNVMIASLSTSESDLRAAKKEWSTRLLGSRPGAAFGAFAAKSPAPESNVVGVGMGEKYAGDQPTGVLALKFLVVRKYPEGQLSAGELLPRQVDGLPVDVEEVGVLRRQKSAAPAPQLTIPNPRTRIRPARSGASIGFVSPMTRMAGTLGALVTDGKELYLLSNSHVIADEGRLAAGTPIVQPGTLDGGAPGDAIAELTRAVPFATTGNVVDAAIARVIKGEDVSRDVLHIGPASGVTRASVDMAVHKFGRTTSYTVGRVTSVETDVNVEYDTGVFRFDDQVIIVGRGGKPFSAAGDSGSLILERGTNLAVGLLFAGSSSHTVANHLDVVLRKLKVKLA